MKKKQDLICVTDFSFDEINKLFDFTVKLKKDSKKNKFKKYLKGKTLALMFSKTSTRTRLSFEIGIYQLGGIGIYIDMSKTQLSKGESIYDTAQVMGRYVDGIMIRTYSHKEVQDLASSSPIPVINGLTDYLHPCQALSDFFTIFEYKKTFKGLKLSFIGDGNNVARSLMLLSAILGTNYTIASPDGFELDKESIDIAKKISEKTGSQLSFLRSPEEAADNADIIYTDVWVSMGMENEREKREKAFKNYQINNKLLSLCKKDVIVMHCLPAMRGLEITDEVMDGKNSVVFNQAENRLHVQKAIMIKLMCDKNYF